MTFSGDGKYTFAGNSADQNGGAIYANDTLSFSGGGSYTFEKNIAGRNGGAIYASGSYSAKLPLLEISSGVTFTNNYASTSVSGDMSKGRGGAIFIDAEYNNITFTLNVLNTANGAILFQGNTMNPGDTGVIPNGIYFGNLNYGGSGSKTITAAFDVEAGAKFWMLDPMASQKDNLQYLSITYHNLALAINKTGLGTWVLAGHNDMQSASNWTISEGNLFLVYQKYGAGDDLTPVHIELANTTNAMGVSDPATFTLKSGAGFIVEPGNNDPHFITGQSITLEAGSTSAVAGFMYGPILDPGKYVLLTLNEGGGTLINDQDIVQSTNGTVSVGAYDYEYESLEWENAMHDLVFTVRGKKFDPDKGGVPAISGPDKIVLYSRTQSFDAIDQRSRNLFGSCRDNAMSYRQLNNLWATPSYSTVTRTRGTHGMFDVNAVVTAFGYDRRLSRYTFAGIGAALSSPEYSSGKTYIKSDDFAFTFYGGTKLASHTELAGRIGFGNTQFRQSRGVETERHASEYDGHSFFVGVGASRLLESRRSGLCFRPGVQYDFLGMTTEGFRESGIDTFMLHVDNYTQNLHRVKTGIDLNWQPTRGFNATGEVYYLGLFGGRSAQTQARFANDPGNAFDVTGWPIEQNSLGLGLQLSVPLGRQWEFGAGYTALIGRNTTSQQANLNAVWKF